LTRNRLFLFLAAFLFSTGGAAIKGCSLSDWQVAGFRSGIAALALFIFLPESRQVWRLRTWLVALAYAATLVLFVVSTKLTTSANAIFLQSTAPLYLLLLGPLILRERIRRVDVIVIAAVAAGALLLFSGRQHAIATAPDPARGDLLGALTGITWALALTGLRWVGKRGEISESPAAIVSAGNVVAFLICLPAALPVRSAAPQDVAILIYMGVFQIGLAYVLLTRAIRHVPGLEAATLLLVEPVFNPVWTWAIYSERPSPEALGGGALILGATFAGTWWRATRAKQATLS